MRGSCCRSRRRPTRRFPTTGQEESEDDERDNRSPDVDRRARHSPDAIPSRRPLDAAFEATIYRSADPPKIIQTSSSATPSPPPVGVGGDASIEQPFVEGSFRRCPADGIHKRARRPPARDAVTTHLCSAENGSDLRPYGGDGPGGEAEASHALHSGFGVRPGFWTGNPPLRGRGRSALPYVR